MRGEVLELKDTINTMVDQLRSFAAEVTRVAREVGTEGRLGGQAQVAGVSGTWHDLTESVNSMAGNLTTQVRDIATVTTTVANGDLSQKISVEAKGEVAGLAETINRTVKSTKEEQAELVASRPAAFGVAPYVGRYGWVQVTLGEVSADELRELIVEAWRLTAPKKLVREYDAAAQTGADR